MVMTTDVEVSEEEEEGSVVNIVNISEGHYEHSRSKGKGHSLNKQPDRIERK